MSYDNKKSMAFLTGLDNKLRGKEADAKNQSKNEEKEKSEKRQVMLTLRDYNLIYAMPFFCTIATRLPLIYFVIEMRINFGKSLNIISLFIGAFHLCRTISIAGSIIAPKLLHLFGCTIGLAGFSILLFADNTNFTVFVLGNIATGFAEASSHVFVYSKQHYATDITKMRMAMSYQSAVIGVAVILGFFFGGMAFQCYGVNGIAISGMVVLVFEVTSLLYFFTYPPNTDLDQPLSNNYDKKCIMKCEEPGSLSEKESRHEAEDIHRVFQADYVIDNEDSRVASHKLDTALEGETDNNTIVINDDDDDNDDEDSEMDSEKDNAAHEMNLKNLRMSECHRAYANHEGIVPHSFTYLITAMFSIESIASGYLLSIGPLFIFETFGVNQICIGTLFSLASLFGSVITILAISPKGRALQQHYLRCPYNLYVLITIMTMAIFGATIPSFPMHVISIILLIGASELFLTLMSELQGAITTPYYYDVLGPSAQMFRRILNIVMAVSGPCAYNIFSRLPYIISGSICTVYTMVFVYLTERHRKQDKKLLDKDSMENLHRLSLPSMEVMARLVSFNLKSVQDSNMVYR